MTLLVDIYIKIKISKIKQMINNIIAVKLFLYKHYKFNRFIN